MIQGVSSVAIFLMLSCGRNDSDAPAVVNQDFPSTLLINFLEWNPVLEGDMTFASTGHSGQTVRVYFNETAKNYFDDDTASAFDEGSYVAKAVVSSLDTQAEDASRVYFMLKKPEGFDPDNNDWSYAVANRKDGSWVYNEEQGSLENCYSCHSNESEWDYVKTVDFYRRQTVD
jgi:hypothetical protein